MPSLMATPDPEKEILRQQVAGHVADYIAKGGKIHRHDIQARDGELQRDKNGRVELTINPDRAKDRRQAWKEGDAL